MDFLHTYFAVHTEGSGHVAEELYYGDLDMTPA